MNQDNTEYKPKIEHKPLFIPNNGLTIVNNISDTLVYYRNGRQTMNEQLYEKIRITPGINLKYNKKQDL
jgi:hypothetical protein